MKHYAGRQWILFQHVHQKLVRRLPEDRVKVKQEAEGELRPSEREADSCPAMCPKYFYITLATLQLLRCSSPQAPPLPKLRVFAHIQTCLVL